MRVVKLHFSESVAPKFTIIHIQKPSTISRNIKNTVKKGTSSNYFLLQWHTQKFRKCGTVTLQPAERYIVEILIFCMRS